MNTTMTAVGTFTDRSDAVAAVRDLKEAGFTENQIGLISRQDVEQGQGSQPAHSGLKHDPTHTHWEEGAGIGAAAGALTGTGLGLAVLAGVIPPLGPIVAGGALVALIASAGGGATVGTIVGGLVGLGIPEDEASIYEEHVSSGLTLVAVSADQRYEEAVGIIRKHNGTIHTGIPEANE